MATTPQPVHMTVEADLQEFTRAIENYDVRVEPGIFPSQTLREPVPIPRDCTLEEVMVFADVAPVSAAGTYTLRVQNGAGTDMINGAGGTFNLEALVSDVPTSLTPGDVNGTTLVAAVATRNLAENDELILTIASNNADLTGEGLVIHLILSPRVSFAV